MRKTRLAALAALTALATTASVMPAAASYDDVAGCREIVAARAGASASLAQLACTTWVAQRTDATALPTVALLWTDVGLTSPDAQVAVAGWPIHASCLILGAITSASTAYYVLAGEAETLGPATSTRITCSASPSGLYARQTLPGAAAAAVDVTTTLFPGDALTRQSVCTKGEAYYAVRPAYMTTGILGACLTL